MTRQDELLAEMDEDKLLHWLFQDALDVQRKAERKGLTSVKSSATRTQITAIKQKVTG